MPPSECAASFMIFMYTLPTYVPAGPWLFLLWHIIVCNALPTGVVSTQREVSALIPTSRVGSWLVAQLPYDPYSQALLLVPWLQSFDNHSLRLAWSFNLCAAIVFGSRQHTYFQAVYPISGSLSYVLLCCCRTCTVLSFDPMVKGSWSW